MAVASSNPYMPRGGDGASAQDELLRQLVAQAMTNAPTRGSSGGNAGLPPVTVGSANVALPPPRGGDGGNAISVPATTGSAAVFTPPPPPPAAPLTIESPSYGVGPQTQPEAPSVGRGNNNNNRGGDGGGNNNNNNRGGDGGKNNNNNGGGGNNAQSPAPVVGPSPGAPVSAVSAAANDPAAWYRQKLAEAGFDLSNQVLYDFFQRQLIDPFVRGWEQWKVMNPGTSTTFQDYANTQPWATAPGGMQAYVQGQLDRYQPTIAADPGAWLRGKMQAAGYDPFGSLGGALASYVTEPFTAGWEAFQADPANLNKTISDYIAGQPWGTHRRGGDGSNNPFLGTPRGSNGGNAATGEAPGPNLNANVLGELPSLTTVPAAASRGSEGGNVGLPPAQAARGGDGGNSGLPSPASPPTPTGSLANPFGNYVQNVLDRLTPQQKGIYSPGKDKTGARWSVYF